MGILDHLFSFFQSFFLLSPSAPQKRQICRGQTDIYIYIWGLDLMVGAPGITGSEATFTFYLSHDQLMSHMTAQVR